MNFAQDPDDPGFEQRWHREWMEEGARWLERVKPILHRRFERLAADPDPEWPLVPIEEGFPLWSPYRAPSAPPPWRVGFVGMSGPGMTTITVAFSRLPPEAARERFKRELIQDLALPDPEKRGF